MFRILKNMCESCSNITISGNNFINFRRRRYPAPKELAEVNAAISAVVSGAQSYTVGSRSLTRASLAELRRLKDDLLAELDELENGGSRGRLVGWVGR